MPMKMASAAPDGLHPALSPIHKSNWGHRVRPHFAAWRIQTVPILQRGGIIDGKTGTLSQTPKQATDFSDLDDVARKQVKYWINLPVIEPLEFAAPPRYSRNFGACMQRVCFLLK